MAATAFFSHAALRHPHCSLVDRAKLITRHRRERQTAAGLRPERAGEGARGGSERGVYHLAWLFHMASKLILPSHFTRSAPHGVRSEGGRGRTVVHGNCAERRSKNLKPWSVRTALEKAPFKLAETSLRGRTPRNPRTLRTGGRAGAGERGRLQRAFFPR